MLFDLVDTLQERKRLVFIALFVLADIVLLSFCTQTLQAHRSNITERINNSQKTRAVSEYASATEQIHHASVALEVGVLRAVVAATDTVANIERGVQAAGKAALHTTGAAITATAHGIGYAAHVTEQVITAPSVATEYGAKYAFRATSGAVRAPFASVIKPKNDIIVPVITPAQAEQASLIQIDTISFEPIKPMGSGGACDNGNGNGGYPMEWCDAPRDTLSTKAGGGRINRECTSYAYWYFTEVLGHRDFNVTGDAKYWARTTNYPVHQQPAAGAIAVETAGRYGHVAIVQALPGQTYEGAVVPDGYVLVSEMNYDWCGHFRYSYSPLTKFSAYIYP